MMVLCGLEACELASFCQARQKCGDEEMSFYFPDPDHLVDEFPPLKDGTRVLLISTPVDPDTPFARIFAQGTVEKRESDAPSLLIVDELGDPAVDLDAEWPTKRASIWRRICESLGLHF